jgi:3-isopropylmalate/(R)-2-methylmalate dehydratase small subunit
MYSIQQEKTYKKNNMAKKTITIINATCVPLSNENVDTDQIIPARFLKSITREGFGENLFRDWRYNADGTQKKEFVLNNPTYKGEVLVAGNNFGCGSSREHAAWAIADYGFNAVVSSSFGDIFRNNALNNQLLPVQVTEPFLKALLTQIQNDPTTKVVIDLQKQTISAPTLQQTETFTINPYKKMCLMYGYDDIDYLLSLKGKIEEFEKKRENDYSLA